MSAAERSWAERRQRQLIRQADAMACEVDRCPDLPGFLASWSEARRSWLIEEANWLRACLGLPLIPGNREPETGQGIDTAAQLG